MQGDFYKSARLAKTRKKGQNGQKERSTAQQKVDFFPDQRSSLIHGLFLEHSRLQGLYGKGKADGEAWLKASILWSQQ